MGFVVGPWFGGSSPARIEIDYEVTYNADQTSVHFSGMVYLATRYAISDTINSWSVSGDLGSASGSNVNVQHGSAGGRTAIKSIAGWRQGNAVINASISGLEAIGETVVANGLVLESGALAPYITNFQARGITSTSFIADVVSWVANGGNLNNTQVGYNTAQSDTGAKYIQKGSFGDGDITVPAINPGTLYYFKMRLHSDTYAWGPWTAWKSVTTLPGVYIKYNGVWRNAIPYVKVGGVWKQAVRYVKTSGVWK